MPRYDYHCDENGQTVEVLHSISVELKTWGEVCEATGLDLDGTDANAPVRKVITLPPMANTPVGDSHLKNLGFTKLVKRSDGTYENVTRTGTESRFLDPGNPSTLPHIHKKHSD